MLCRVMAARRVGAAALRLPTMRAMVAQTRRAGGASVVAAGAGWAACAAAVRCDDDDDDDKPLTERELKLKQYIDGLQAQAKE